METWHIVHSWLLPDNISYELRNILHEPMLWLCKDIPSTVHYCCNCTCNCFFNDRFGPSTLVSFVHCLWLQTRAITGRHWEKPETYEPLGQALKPRQKELCTESWCTRSLGQSRELRQLCQVCMSEMMYVCQKDMWMCISICMPMCRCLYKC